jgi:asparagine synthetase B (glutamine-hydrolysing)
MFAFAAFDRESGDLTLARDPFGEKPLYYMELPGGGLAFASELQALERVPGFHGEVSLDAMAEMLMFQYIGAPRTIYKNVKKLPPGHWLVASAEVNRTGTVSTSSVPAARILIVGRCGTGDELEALLRAGAGAVSSRTYRSISSGGWIRPRVCLITEAWLLLKTFSIGFSARPRRREAARAFAAHLGRSIAIRSRRRTQANFSGDRRHPGRTQRRQLRMPTYLLSELATTA